MLMKTGGWVEGQEEPRVGVAEEGSYSNVSSFSFSVYVCSLILTSGCQKIVARKARKQQSLGRFLLPALDLAYIFQDIDHAPRGVMVRRMLPDSEVDAALKLLGVFDDVVAAEAEAVASSSAAKTSEVEWRKRERAYAEGGKGYWDDYCLAMFLRGVCLRYVAYPVRIILLRRAHLC